VAQNVCISLIASLEDLYAFHYTASDVESSKQREGWNLFDLKSEYLRMGVPNENWVVSNINQTYEVRISLRGYIFSQREYFACRMNRE